LRGLIECCCSSGVWLLGVVAVCGDICDVCVELLREGLQLCGQRGGGTDVSPLVLLPKE
jgi:hypothetical protein